VGCNALDATFIPRSTDTYPCAMDMIICSGGDDQSISISRGSIVPSLSGNVKLTMHDIERVVNVAGSAIKGIQLLHPRAADSNTGWLIASVGYDQRLNLWSLAPISPDEGYEAAAADARIANQVESRWLKWRAGIVTHVTDVNAMTASTAYDRIDGSAKHQIMTIGEGFEICDV
jgi:hypothetical protein